MTPPIFGITGWKNSGKTTLTERLVAEFTERGLVVSTVKHAHHRFDIDTPGTDSHRHRLGPGQHARSGEVGRPVRCAGQPGQPAAAPRAGGVVHRTIVARLEMQRGESPVQNRAIRAAVGHRVDNRTQGEHPAAVAGQRLGRFHV